MNPCRVLSWLLKSCAVRYEPVQGQLRTYVRGVIQFLHCSASDVPDACGQLAVSICLRRFRRWCSCLEFMLIITTVWQTAETKTLRDGQFLLPGFVDTHTHGPQYENAGKGTVTITTACRSLQALD